MDTTKDTTKDTIVTVGAIGQANVKVNMTKLAADHPDYWVGSTEVAEVAAEKLARRVYGRRRYSANARHDATSVPDGDEIFEVSVVGTDGPHRSLWIVVPAGVGGPT